jgi:hypothetical protein
MRFSTILTAVAILASCGKSDDTGETGSTTETGETGETGHTGETGTTSVNDVELLEIVNPSDAEILLPGASVALTAELTGTFVPDALVASVEVNGEPVNFDIDNSGIVANITCEYGQNTGVMSVEDDEALHTDTVMWIGNTAPVVSLDPTPTPLVQGDSVTVTGLVFDADTPEDIFLTWMLDGEIYHTEMAPLDGTVSLYFAEAPGGEHVIELIAEDEWESTSDQVAFDVECAVTDNVQMLLHMDDGSGVAVADSSYDPSEVSLVGSPLWIDGMDGRGVDLGGNSYVSALDPQYPDLWTMDFTFSAWLMPDSDVPAGNEAIFQQLDGQGMGRTLLYRSTSCGNALTSYLGGATLCGTTPLNAGQWNHVVLTRNRTTGKIAIYLNGVLEGEADRFMEFADGGYLFGVGKTASSQYFDGAIDEIAIMSSTLDAAEVLALYNTGLPTCDPGCIDLPETPYTWFDGSVDGNGDLLDHGQNQSIQVEGGYTIGDGTSGDAVHLDGATGYFELSGTQSYSVSDSDFTVSLRARFDGTTFVGEDRTLVQILDGTGLGRTLLYVDDSCGGQISSYIGGQEFCSGTLTAGLWHHVAITHSQGDNLTQIYIDGIGKPVAPRTMAASDGGLRFGTGKTFNGQWWDGPIDDILIFDRVLTDLEMEDLHSDGTGYCPL